MNTLLVILGGSLLALPLLCGLAYLVYYCFSLPLRRHERARFFLDLVDTGLKDGQSIEHTINGVSGCDDRSLGRKFWAFGALLRQGMTFDQALPLIPRFLPEQIIGMLRAGMELDDLRKVIPACRAELKGAVDRVWTASHYLMILAFVVTPAWTFVFTVLAVFVFPRFEQIAMDMGAGAPSQFQALLRYRQPLLTFQISLMVICYTGAAHYIGGPEVSGWLDRLLPRVGQRVAFGTPWRRKRMQRNFSSLLATLLDSGVPEPRAVTLAAEGVANAVFTRRAAAAADDLARGMSLPDALGRLDDGGEFRWRLENAAHSGGGFVAALSGWHEALEAKAYQQEQIAAQLITTALVLINGVFVGTLAAAVFNLLIHIMEVAPLW